MLKRWLLTILSLQAVKVDMNTARYLNESTLDELEREGFFIKLMGK